MGSLLLQRGGRGERELKGMRSGVCVCVCVCCEEELQRLNGPPHSILFVGEALSAMGGGSVAPPFLYNYSQQFRVGACCMTKLGRRSRLFYK